MRNIIKIYQEEFLEAFGKFFRNGMRVYLYPYKDPETHELLDSETLKWKKILKNCINISNVTTVL
jgi:hypothetical protein